MFSFKSQLRSGEVGEILWLEANGDSVVKLDGFKSDFKDAETGHGIELKSDYYCMNSTPNFFFERFSDKHRETPGGPWQAATHGSKTFVYFYVRNLTYFTFETKKLVKALDKIIQELTPTDVPNKSYITQGYRVPRDLLQGLYTEWRVSAKAKQVKK